MKQLFPHTDRDDIVEANKKREDIRHKLKGDAAQAREELSPRNQVNRLIVKSKNRIDDATAKAYKTARRAAPAVGLASIGAIVFVGRKPISRWISRLRKPKDK